MKKILAILLSLMLVVLALPVLAEEATNEEVLPIPCLVTGNNVRERTGPGLEYDVVRKHKKDEVLDVIDTTGEWWKLSNGNYMSAQYLSPMCENDLPGADVEVINNVLEAIADSKQPRVLGLVYGGGMTREDLIAKLHDFVLLKVSDQCIECYQNDTLQVQIKLTTSVLDIKFKVVSAADGGEYYVHSPEEIVDLIFNYSKDWTHFVVLP